MGQAEQPAPARKAEGFGRYAPYLAPEPSDPWWHAGISWLGSGPVTGRRVPPLALDGLPHDEWERITEAPRFYGWHATLKPPFALADGCTEQDLVARVRAFCASRKGFDLAGLAVRPLGTFLALRPTGDQRAIQELADACVRDFDDLRQPMGAEERARREAAGLTARQRELMERWGYPYVFEEFRFHLSLTGPLDPERLTALSQALSARWALLSNRPFPVTGLCVFRQPARTAPFRMRWRIRWGGEVEGTEGLR